MSPSQDSGCKGQGPHELITISRSSTSTMPSPLIGRDIAGTEANKFPTQRAIRGRRRIPRETGEACAQRVIDADQNTFGWLGISRVLSHPIDLLRLQSRTQAFASAQFELCERR